MGGRLVEFPLRDGGSILVETAERTDLRDQVTRGLHQERSLDHAQQTFEQAIVRVQPVAEAIIGRLRFIADPPDEVHVEFGLELSAEAGAFIASASTAANFKVSLSWHASHEGDASGGIEERDEAAARN